MKGNRMFRLFCAVLALVCCFAASPARAEKPLHFTILRKGEAVGTHDMTFTRKDDTLTVGIHTHVFVKVLFITYKFTCDSTETWKDGKLVALEAHTNDDGDKHDVSVAQKDGKLQLTADGKTSVISADTITSSWWNKKLTGRPELLDYLTGKMQSIKVKDLGAETVQADGKDIATEHYKVDGGLQRDLWFAGDRMVRQSLVKRGDLIEYALK
jgi:hypothetical protein